MPTSSIEAIIDFSDRKQLREWIVVNDGVMGGLSRGKVEITDQGAVFTGSVSLENNGGFTSFRSPYSRIDLSAYTHIEIKYKSTGLPCALSFYRYSRFWRPNHKLALPLSEEWTILKRPLLDLDEYRMGNATGDKMNQNDLEEIIRLGFITDSKSEGEFQFEVAYIKFISTNN